MRSIKQIAAVEAARTMGAGTVIAHVGLPSASRTRRIRIIEALFARADCFEVHTKSDSPRVSNRTEYSAVSEIPREVLRGDVRRTIVARFRSFDKAWFERAVAPLRMPSRVRNPRALFGRNSSVLRSARRSVANGQFEMLLALGETNPTEFLVFLAASSVAAQVYESVRTKVKTPKVYAAFGGLPKL